MYQNTLDNFWKNVRKTAKGGCWFWKGTRGINYGQIMINRKLWLAHRLSWEIHNGPLPKATHRVCVCHRCDNPLCVNPAHLFLGSIAENLKDSYKKERHSHGETHRLSKLTEDQAIIIKTMLNLGWGQTRLSRVFGVAKTNIHHIKKGTSWKHLDRLEEHLKK